MYDEEISHALKTRCYNTIQANEYSLLSEIKFTLERNSIECAGTKQYSDEFLDALKEHGVTVTAPKSSNDKWIFDLPDMEVGYDNY